MTVNLILVQICPTYHIYMTLILDFPSFFKTWAIVLYHKIKNIIDIYDVDLKYFHSGEH
jgi:hypothetical protein